MAQDPRVEALLKAIGGNRDPRWDILSKASGMNAPPAPLPPQRDPRWDILGKASGISAPPPPQPRQPLAPPRSDPRLDALRKATGIEANDQDWMGAASNLGPASANQGYPNKESNRGSPFTFDDIGASIDQGLADISGEDWPGMPGIMTQPIRPPMFRSPSTAPPPLPDDWQNLVPDQGSISRGDLGGDTGALGDFLSPPPQAQGRGVLPDYDRGAPWQSGEIWAATREGSPEASGKANMETLLRDMGRNLDMEKKYPQQRTGEPTIGLGGPANIVDGQMVNRMEGLTGGTSTGATPTDVGHFASLLSGSPDFGTAATARDQASRAAYDTAIAEGYRGAPGMPYDPVAEKAKYGRQQAETEMNLPLRQTEAAGRSQQATQEIANKGLLDVANVEQRGAENLARQQIELYNKMIASGRQLPSINMRTGNIGATRAPVQIPTRLLEGAAAARRNWLAAIESDQNSYFGQLTAPAAEDDFRVALGAIAAQDPSSRGIQDLAIDIAMNPTINQMSLDNILMALAIGVETDELDANGQPGILKIDTAALDGLEIEDLDRLLNYFRGIY